MRAVMQMTLEKRVEKAIDEAIELADLGGQHIPASRIAERLFEGQTELMKEVSQSWIIERLAWMISRRRRASWNRAHPSGQMVLADPVFQGLPRTIFLRNGMRPALEQCIVSQTRDHLTLLRRRFNNSPRIVQFEALVEIHAKWAATRRNITWGDAMRLEAEERELEGMNRC